MTESQHAAIGDNQPPEEAGIAERLPLIYAELIARVDELVEAGGRIPAIKNDDIAAKATTFMGQLGRALKRCGTGKSAARKPLNADAATIKEFFDDLEGRLKRAQGHVREPLTVYQLEKERQAAEAAKARQEAAQQGQEPEKDAFGLSPIPDGKTRDDLGQTTSIVRTWHYEIIDLNLVPREYLELAKGKMNKAVQAGARKIPGVRIFEQKQAVTHSAPPNEEN